MFQKSCKRCTQFCKLNIPLNGLKTGASEHDCTGLVSYILMLFWGKHNVHTKKNPFFLADTQFIESSIPVQFPSLSSNIEFTLNGMNILRIALGHTNNTLPQKTFIKYILSLNPNYCIQRRLPVAVVFPPSHNSLYAFHSYQYIFFTLLFSKGPTNPVMPLFLTLAHHEHIVLTSLFNKLTP